MRVSEREDVQRGGWARDSSTGALFSSSLTAVDVVELRDRCDIGPRR